MEIRRAKIEDAQVLSKLATDTFFDTFTGTCTDEDMSGFIEEYFNINQVKKELKDNNDFYFFAEIDSVPVGYVRFKEDYRNFPVTEKCKALELKRLYVKKGISWQRCCTKINGFCD
ncbi:MAG: hypothetical protein IPJ81_09270 [Chitinophagaceae bacterium]|nr:hypothetical protein [Chitinophagaceae bacterium]